MSGDKTLRSEIGAALKIEFADIKIPPRPAVLSSIEKEMRSKSPNLAALEKVISLDVGISASLLKVANSAFFGASAQIRSIKAALQILGLDLVGTTLSALYLRQAFSHVQHFERFWDSSARTAQLSGWLVNQIPPAYRKAKSEEAYTFGLFRDCGIPIMFSMLSDYFSILGRANDEAARPFTAIEDDEIGWNHTQAGALLATEWRLPMEYRAAIEWHHDVDALLGLKPHLTSDLSRFYIAIAQFAEYLYQQLTGLDQTKEWCKLGDACLSILGVPSEDIVKITRLAEQDAVYTVPVV